LFSVATKRRDQNARPKTAPFFVSFSVSRCEVGDNLFVFLFCKWMFCVFSVGRPHFGFCLSSRFPFGKTGKERVPQSVPRYETMLGLLSVRFSLEGRPENNGGGVPPPNPVVPPPFCKRGRLPSQTTFAAAPCQTN